MMVESQVEDLTYRPSLITLSKGGGSTREAPDTPDSGTEEIDAGGGIELKWAGPGLMIGEKEM